MENFNLETFVLHIESFVEEDFIANTITPLQELKEFAQTDIKYRMELFISCLQAQFIRKFSLFEVDKKFQVDPWSRIEKKGKGGGITCVLQNGDVFEKAGVNISVLWGSLRPGHAELMKKQGKNIPEGEDLAYYATGLSCIIHPRNPFVPSFHFNCRYFQVSNGQENIWWFGGSCNMTPFYVNTEDFKHFHGRLKDACDQHDPSYYSDFKTREDFCSYIKHRGEYRGIGGVRFELLQTDGRPVNEYFNFIMTFSNAALPSYLPIVDLHKDDAYDEKHRLWQEIRRGRYIEYNLMYEKGMKFGLTTPDVRVESVLVSLPPKARWDSLYEVQPGSEEEKMVEVLQNPRWWAQL